MSPKALWKIYKLPKTKLENKEAKEEKRIYITKPQKPKTHFAIDILLNF